MITPHYISGVFYLHKFKICSIFVKKINVKIIDLNINNMRDNKKLPKLLIIGAARWGKDSMAEILQEHFNLKFKSSSEAAAEIFIYDLLSQKYGYTTPFECFEDRVNHRAEWHQLICDYNIQDKARLAKGILNQADCYVGMRDSKEIKECIKQDLFDLIIWVDASERLPLEDVSSFNITKADADIIIDNNGTFEEFKERVIRLGKSLIKTH